MGRLCGRQDISVKAYACRMLAGGGGGIGTVLEGEGREECAQRDRAGKDSSLFWGRGPTGVKMCARQK